MIEQLQAALAVFFARESSAVLLDLLDIALVALLVYWLLLLLRGARAMQTGFGLALLFVAYHAARRFGMTTLWTILDSLLTYLVLIVVVIFQNDIRRALSRFGRRPLFPNQRHAQQSHLLDEVVKAAAALINKRIGALMVIERDSLLDEFIEPGVELDAVVSKELLYSLFVPSYENPMHDGAVILREGRVWQAGAFLPLATRRDLERSLGTRHRAGLGISEETDAVVVVVSEERGTCSLCFNGNLVCDLDASALRQALIGVLQQGHRQREVERAPRDTSSMADAEDVEAESPANAPAGKPEARP